MNESKIKFLVDNEELIDFLVQLNSIEGINPELETKNNEIENIDLKSSKVNIHPSYKLDFAELTPILISLVSSTITLATVIFEYLKKKKESNGGEKNIYIIVNEKPIDLGESQSIEEIDQLILESLDKEEEILPNKIQNGE